MSRVWLNFGFLPWIHPYGREAAVIGEVEGGASGVRMRTLAGGLRAVDYPVGDQLPRIC